MAQLIDIDLIIQNVTGRSTSLFQQDIDVNRNRLIQEIESKSFLVIGGAGTIGSNFIKAVLALAKPSKLIVVDINENELTELVRDLRSASHYHLPEDIRTYPINFSDKVFTKLFRNEAPFDVVANFAAHKHVRSEKDIISIEAMIFNNVINAKILLDSLLEVKPKHFFCVSTDKAANPVNIMGATKKLMEDMIMAYSTYFKISTARFANVAFSNGSLPAGFIQRLLKKQPIAGPPDVKRFFVSPIESGQICMMACLLGNSGDVFFPKLDMENDMKPFSLFIENILSQLGYELEICSSDEEAREKSKSWQMGMPYPVYYSPSDTSGEKSYEEFYTELETLDMDSFSALGVVKEIKKKPIEEINLMFDELQHIFTQDKLSKQMIVNLLVRYIENFDHIETGKGLDGKM